VTNPEDGFGNFAKRSSSKWLRYPADVLPMHVAEMDFEIAEPIKTKLTEMVRASDIGYLGPLPELAAAFESFALDRWGWRADGKQLRLATDVGVAAVEILRAVTNPGDRVLVNSPVYAAFYKWISEVGAVPADAVHSAKDLTAIAKLAKEYSVLVIADEIHAPLSWVPFTPYLSLGSEAEETGVVISSSSKAWNAAGLKAGFLITQSDAVKARLSKLPEALNFRASLLGAHAMVTAYRDGTQWLDETVRRIQENLAHLHIELAERLPKARAFAMESTYLAWLDLGAYGVDNLQEEILREAKVSVVAGSDHSHLGEYKNFIRFNFATSKPRITEAVRRIANLLEG